MRPLTSHHVLLLTAAAIVIASLSAISPTAAFVTTSRTSIRNAATKIISGTTTRSLPSLTGTSSSFSSSIRLLLSSSNSVDNEDAAVAGVKLRIEESIANTDKGRSLQSPSQKTQIHSLLSNLESLCPLSEPARDARMEGPWIVLYTDAPPPSNGQLGFWKGVAKQVIDLEKKRYRNELYVGGGGADGDEGAWLGAVLDARWDEWDGVYLENEGGGSGSGSVAAEEDDPGATTWKVDFESITLSLFQIPIFTQQFKAGTARTWRMSYLDDDTRIVRAGKTGRGEDDWIFYMRRGSS
mmetsp:Transcript_39737/g.69880  ORF Transcript_39737/g.69880 Transcript_39737/m.69880 type:complete len:296 (-) Transcript_39737:78-965(-)